MPPYVVPPCILNKIQLFLQVTDLRKNSYYLNTYIIVNFLGMTVVPVVVLSVCHYFTLKKIREANARHNAISSHQG